MRPDRVVMLAPSLNDLASVMEIREPVRIQTGITELAVEALKKRILCGFAGLNEMQRHAAALRPQERRPRFMARWSKKRTTAVLEIEVSTRCPTHSRL